MILSPRNTVLHLTAWHLELRHPERTSLTSRAGAIAWTSGPLIIASAVAIVAAIAR